LPVPAELTPLVASVVEVVVVPTAEVVEVAPPAAAVVVERGTTVAVVALLAAVVTVDVLDPPVATEVDVTDAGAVVEAPAGASVVVDPVPGADALLSESVSRSVTRPITLPTNKSTTSVRRARTCLSVVRVSPPRSNAQHGSAKATSASRLTGGSRPDRAVQGDPELLSNL
jgi:hypothetical protein